MRQRVSAFILLFLFWVLLSFSLEPGFLVVGALLTVLVVLLTSGKYPHREWLLNPLRWLWLLVYIPYFLYYCIRANLDVAVRVIHPDVPIQPGIVKVRTTLKGEMAKTFLANSITLTPGTLTLDIDDQDFYVHWINIASQDAQKNTQEICGRFEPLLRRIFE